MIKIYNIYKGKLVSAYAVETKKSFILNERTLEFDCRKTIPKKDASVTPEQAIEYERNKLLVNISNYEVSIKNEKIMLENLEKIKSQLNATNIKTK